jgi:DNA mismatch repair ATPase MutL
MNMKILNYKKMVDEIDDLVENDFVADMECRAGLPNQRPFTQKEAKAMARLLSSIYSIAHCNTCEACQNKYLIHHPPMAKKVIKD